jgi:hypothetical protein
MPGQWREEKRALAANIGACRKVCEQVEKRADWLGLQAGLPSYGHCEMRLRPAHPTAIFKLCDRSREGTTSAYVAELSCYVTRSVRPVP